MKTDLVAKYRKLGIAYAHGNMTRELIMSLIWINVEKSFLDIHKKKGTNVHEPECYKVEHQAIDRKR